VSPNSDVLIYVPGGSFVLGPSPLVIALITEIAKKAGLALFMPAYRLAPEHPCPAAIEDISSFLSAIGTTTNRIILCGEQIGPNLILAALQNVDASVLDRIAAMIFLSPWLDLSLSSWSSLTVQMGVMHVHSREQAELAVRLYLGMENPTFAPSDQQVSPLFGALSHLPPTLIHACESDISLDDAKVLHDKLLVYHSESELHIWPRVAHMWERYELPYCKDSIAICVDFMLAHLP